MVADAASPAFVLIILGSESDAAIMQATLEVFCELQIPSQTVLLRDLGEDEQRTAYLEDAQQRGLGAVIVATAYSYTDEPFPTVSESLVPVIKVITDPGPSAEQFLALNLATTGFGTEGAKNAGILVAKMLALGDPALRDRLRDFLSR